MKKILIAVAFVATLVSCGGHNKYYFAEPEVRAFNDPTAPFDTLSYAFGINFALPLEGELADLNYNRDLFIEKVTSYITMDNASFPDLTIVNDKFMKFQTERFRPFMMAKQRKAFTKDDQIVVPEIYNEEYDSLMFTNWMAIMASNSVRMSAAPVNIHYVVEGIRDMAGVNNIAYIDSLTKISQMQFMGHLKNYYMTQMGMYNAERAKTWLADIATKPGVKALEVNDATIYYRVNSPGGVKVSGLTDSIALEYEIYNYTGKLIQSTESRFDALRKRIADTKADKTLTDSVRNARIRETENYIESMRMPMNPVSSIRVEAIKHCLAQVGEFGSITIWTPAQFAPQSRQLMANEAVVIDLEVKRIAKGTDVNDLLKRPMKPGAPQQPGAALKPGSPVKVTPVNGTLVTPAPKAADKK